MDHDYAILTPEKTILTYRLAGIGSRVLANILDGVVLFAALTGIAIFSSLVSLADHGVGSALVLISYFAVPFLYFILFEWLWNGQTIGKKATNLRVAMEDGTPVTFMASLTRNLLRPGDFLPAFYFIGMVCMFTNPRSQRVGDIAAKTIVLHEKEPGQLYIMAPHAVGIHQFEESVGELRGMTLDEYDALRRFCDRFYELTPEAQKKLIKDVWIPLAERRNVPENLAVHPLLLAEATVMKYGRKHGLI